MSFKIKLLFVLVILLAAVLRFYKLGTNPPSLYWDEASLGYNAYSILKTARDEHGKFLPLTNFAAFGDYKPPGYIYAAVPSIAVFRLNEFAIRFPSALFGTLTVLVTYFLAKKMFQNEAISLFSAFFLAISPWHIHLSRAAFEANLALFFSVCGIYFFIKFAKENKFFIFASAVFFLLAIYTFTGQRLFVPFILLILTIQFRKEIINNFRLVIFASLTALVLFWPLFKFATGTIEGRLRFDEVSIFKDQTPINQSIEYRQRNNFSLVSNIFYNRRVFYLHEYIKNYFDAFSPAFLFTKGDINPRFSTQLVGQLYYFDLILVPLGIYFLFKKRHSFTLLILGWLLVSPLGPAAAKETPHALRLLQILPTFQILSALGTYELLKNIRWSKLTIAVLGLFVAFELFYFLHAYYVHWPKTYSSEWQYGYKEAVNIAKDKYNDFDNIIVTNTLGRPYIYFLLYMKYPPEKFQESADIKKDRFFFIDVYGFDKFKFGNTDELKLKGKSLYFVTGSLPEDAALISKISDLSEKTVFLIGARHD